MKSYIFAAAALISAVAQGAVLKRASEDCEEPSKSYGGSTSSSAANKPSGHGHESEAPAAFNGAAPVNGTLPCGANSTTTYTVASGDTLNQISSRTGAGVCDIAVASNITNINLINLGQVLFIPACTGPIDNTTCVAVPEKNATETCVPGLPSTYTIVSGDTLTAIAKDFNITLPSLIAANSQIANPDVIDVGQVINIPVCPNSQCSTVGTYSIVSGDIFFDLATKYHTTVGQIKALNPTVNVTAIAVGQQIILPQDCKNVTTAVA